MIPIFKPYMPIDLGELNSILHSGSLAYGKWGRSFELELKRYLKVDHLMTTNSYNSAMLILLATLGLKAGDEVLASPMSCLASNQPFLNRNLKVKWCDIDPKTGTLNPDEVRQNITAKTKAIFHNHHCGIPGYIDEINEIAKSHGLFVVNDCIEAFGSEYKGNIIGNLGSDASIYSFQTVRLPNTIEGGAITFKDERLFQKASIIRDYGIDRSKFRDVLNEINPECDIEVEGFGGLLSDVNSYIGHQQMADIPVLLNKQRTIANAWKSYFNDIDKTVEILGDRIDIFPNYWVFSILTNNKSNLLNFFRNKGFYASGIHLNNNKYSAFGDLTELKGVNDFMRKHLALPCGWWIDKLEL